VSVEDQYANKRDLGKITVELAKGRSEQEVAQVAKRALPEALVRQESNMLHLGDVVLQFDDNRLVKVVFMNDPPDQKVSPGRSR